MNVQTYGPLAKYRGSGGFYPVLSHKVLFVSVAKNACTSLKWLIAELAGEDFDRFVPRQGMSPNRSAGIHQRSRWQKVPRLRDLDPEVRAEIHPDNGWFVFGVTRDPRTRFFSAWQSKYLVRNPGTLRRPARRAFVPAPPYSAEAVIESFASFTASFAADPRHEAFRGDPHFRDQVGLLKEGRVPYSRIYDVSEIDTLVADLNAHLARQGHPGDLALRTYNDTPLSANGRVFDNGVRELIEQIFVRDFERFGDRWDFRRVEARPLAWTDDALAHVRSLAAAHTRIADLAALSRRLEQRNEKLRRANLRMKREQSAPRGRLSRTLRR